MSNEPDVEDERARLLSAFAETRSEVTRDAVVESFLPLADFFARRYSNRSVELDDLRQVARIGLLKSVDRFDPSLNVRFSTFAGRTIDGEIKHWFRDKSWSIRVPRSIKENVQLVNVSQRKLEQKLNKAPTARQVADDTKLDLELVIEALEARSSYEVARLDVPTSTSGTQTLGDGLDAGDSAVEQADLEMTISTVLEDIPERDREIVEMRFFEQLSQQQIAERVGVSQMQVSRILRRSLAQLQITIRDSLLD